MSAVSFFQPNYLWALGFLLVVLILHFLRRRVVKRMNISTLRFFPMSATNSSRMKKLAALMLLLARLLIVAALIVIFAGPHNKENPLVSLRNPQNVVYTWIDPTMSMEYVEDSKTLGQMARLLADSLLNILPSVVEQYRFDHESGRFISVVGSFGDGKEEQSDFAGRHYPADIEEAFGAFIAATTTAQGAVFMIFSDFQRSTVETLNPILSRLSATGKKVMCVSLAPHIPRNYSVKAMVGYAHKDIVTAVVYAHGKPLSSALVEMFVGHLRIGQKNVSCGADDSVSITFDMPPSHIGSFGRIELHAADPLQFDNIDYFTVSEERNRAALIVGNTERNKVIEAVMRASGTSFWSEIVRKNGGDLSYEDLNSADLVIINDFNGRSRILESFISGVGSDKGIIISLDPDREDDFGRTLMRGADLSIGAVNTSELGIHPVLTDTSSALWRGFPALSSGNSKVYRYMSSIPGDALVRLGDSRPLVASVKIGSADLLVISTPIGVTSSNNLCETGFFVPFIDRLSRYAIARNKRDDEIWYAGYAARNPFFGAGRGATLYDLDGKIVASLSNQPFVRVDRPGVYSFVTPIGDTKFQAVSSHPLESEMIFVRPNLQNVDNIFYFEYERFLEQIADISNNARSHWLWVILGLALCCEALLWRSKAGKKER